MKSSAFYYTLPEGRIAYHPAKQRTAARLLHVPEGSNSFQDLRFYQLAQLLSSDDLLVFNDSKVIPARLHGRKSSGGKVEIFIERILNDRQASCSLSASKRVRDDTILQLSNGTRLRVAAATKNAFYVIESTGDETMESCLYQCGEIPLPPYIRRAANHRDRERYQTVYACSPGSVAAPTAGLHFDTALLRKLAGLGVRMANITLHIGAGTFQPLRTEILEQAHLHSERFTLNAEAAAEIAACRARGGKVIAVGSTALRTLEATCDDAGKLIPQSGETNLFVRPGYAFKVVDVLITNFHLPLSTLFVLVCAFAGLERMHAAYEHAIRKLYRFYSYGDAMWLEKNRAISR